MTLRRALFALPLLLALPLLHCGDDDDGHVTPQPTGDGGPSGTDAATGGPDKPLVLASKVDLLFAVDNSASMGDKQALLGTAVSRILRRLTEASADHKAVTDIHVGVISSSLGTLGGDVCDSNNPRANDGGHLLNKDSDGNVVQGAEGGFLSFGPGGDVAVLERAANDIIVGVGQSGCGFEAQLESMYRFLIQPDPPMSITVENQKVVFNGIDNDVLKQRKAFLRPDSVVAIVMLTDEDDSIADPLANGGTGWAFNARSYPGSAVRRGTSAQGTTAPRGSSACDTNPASPDCVACDACNRDEVCKAKQDANCSALGDPTVQGPSSEGFYGATDDDLNIRFQRMKQRFGVDPQFPVERYINALTNRKVPNRETEHDASGKYVHAETCTNPLFAASLPASGTEDGCHMPDGARSRQLVMFQLIGGLPPALANAAPDWTKILGANPDAYDATGIDPHMLQSTAPRPALLGGGDPESPRGQNGSDPVQGREWDPKKTDLQYACTFVLPAPRACDPNSASCDCSDDAAQPGTPAANPPLCAEDGSANQTRGKAYPTLRELRVVKGLADRGLVGSICSVDTTSGYGPLLDNLATKVATVLVK